MSPVFTNCSHHFSASV